MVLNFEITKVVRINNSQIKYIKKLLSKLEEEDSLLQEPIWLASLLFSN
jgi:hypothetical protein